MSLRFNFSLSILFLLVLSSTALAVPVTFNDINLVDRDISIYQVNDTGSHLVYQGASANATVNLDSSYSYQVVLEPSKNTWFDDPRNALTYFINDAAGQTITFLVFAFAFVGIVKIVFR